MGDQQGSFTRYPLHSQSETLEPSLIDYGLAYVDCLNRVKKFTVSNLTTFSDHCCISMRINVETLMSPVVNVNNSSPDYHLLPDKFVWNQNLADTFLASLNSQESSKEISSFVENSYQSNQTGVNAAVSEFTDIITNTASRVVPMRCVRKGKQNIKRKKWITKECLSLKNRLSRLAKEMKRSPYDTNLRSRYRAAYLGYKTLIRKQQRSHNQELRNKLRNLESNDPKAFWNVVKQIKDDKKEHTNQLPCSELDELVRKYHEYFTKLYTALPENGIDNTGATLFKSYLNGRYRYSYISEFVNSPFTNKEVSDCANSLRTVNLLVLISPE